MFHARFRSLHLAASAIAGALLAFYLFVGSASAQVLVDSPFITSYENWIDPVEERGGNWRVSLLNPTMMETSNIVPANPITPVDDDGSYVPSLLIQNNFTTPGTYDFDARLYTTDDDLFGVVFGYQDSDNYFRVGLRNQTPGNIGGTSGLSVQKVSGGVVTQLNPNGTGPGVPDLVTQAVIDNRDPIDVKVAVNGNNYEVFFNGVSQATGSDPALAAGKIGVQSWAQRNDSGSTPHWGTEVETISVSQGANTLYSGTFTQDQLPVKWRPLNMTNSDGLAMNATGVGEDVGNWGADINNPWIYQQTNGFEFATATAPNVDFLSTAVAVDEPGSAAFSDYQMRLRLGATDNDGIGVLVRVQDDNNFYRINFANEGIGTTGERAPQGLSVQKVRNGVWTELFRDDQNNPLFVHAFGAGTPATTLPVFDLSVAAVGNSLKVQVRDEQGNVFNYPLITDNSDPILTGTVGLQTWGSDNVYFTNFGGEDGPLLSAQSVLPPDVDVVIDRATGNITLTNNGAAPIGIKGIMIGSDGGLDPGMWLSVADNYDRASAPTAGDGSVDSDDAWTIVDQTSTDLSEQEQSGNGGMLGVGQSVNLGNAWVQSQIEDVTVDLELTAGGFGAAAVSFSGTPWQRSDLNTDGSVNASDWDLFFPNMLSDMSLMTAVEQALAGDIDLDGDNDVNDFVLFKSDYDLFNGAGAFDSMIAAVPEPSACALLMCALAAFMVRFRRNAKKACCLVTACVAALSIANKASAVAYDFTTFTPESYPVFSGFPDPVWTTTPTTASLNSNAYATVLYSPDNVLGKKIVGSLTAGGDDDVVGFVLGYQPGDAPFGFGSDYLLIDWKGTDQNFNFVDPAGNFFHDQTPGGDMPLGLALSRIAGLPTGDELWQHTDYTIENPSGGVTELARATNLGSAAYNRSGGSHLFEITYTATNIQVEVDGQLELDVNGTFPDGRFGLYSAWQGPTATWSNFEVLDAGFEGLTAVVDRSNGNITLRNDGTAVVDFDYYQLDSAGNSLDSDDWNSLHEQDFQSAGAGTHQNWQEAGGSSTGSIAEVFLAGNSTLMGMGSAGDTVSIGTAYNNLVNAEDLVFSFRLPSGLILPGNVEYIGVAPGLNGDHNNDGVVNAADYVFWRDRDSGNAAGYTAWRQDFGAGSGSGTAAAVPEPTSLVLLMCAALLCGARSFRLSSLTPGVR